MVYLFIGLNLGMCIAQTTVGTAEVTSTFTRFPIGIVVPGGFLILGLPIYAAAMCIYAH